MTFSQPVTISISYDENALPAGTSESSLTLGTFVKNAWQAVVGSTVDTANNVVKGTTNSFSIYGVIIVENAGSVPASPTNVLSVAADGQVTISWNPVTGVTSYNIYWNTTGNVTTTDNLILGTLSPHLHISLLNGTTYFYRITAVNEVGESAPSIEVSATPEAAATAPDPPLNVQAVAGDGQVAITWDSVRGATSYNLYWNTTGVVTTSENPVVGIQSPYLHTNLANGTTYHYIVTTVNDLGESLPSSEVSAIPEMALPEILTRIVAGDQQLGDRFGISVDIDGDYAIVGTTRDDGAVYIFHRTGPDTWNGGTKLIVPETLSGTADPSVAISGDYAVVGTPENDDGGTIHFLQNAGAAYIFHRTGLNSWDNMTKITAPDALLSGTFRHFGVSVDISGDYVVVVQLGSVLDFARAIGVCVQLGSVLDFAHLSCYFLFMARPLRVEFSGAVYHLTSRGNARRNIYLDDEDRSRFLDLLGREIHQQRWRCYAYCLMSNHYHILIETPEGNLVTGMRRLNGVYTQAFNRRHVQVGHLFQGRYKSIVVDREPYLLELCRYIVLNPVRAKMVQKAQDWPWSSYRATAGLIAAPNWLDLQHVFEQLGSQRPAKAAYRRFVEEGVSRESPWVKLRGQVWLGRQEFLERMQKLVRRESLDGVPKEQTLPIRPGQEEVIRRVCKVYDVREGQVVGRLHPEAYQAAVYLLRRVVNLTLKEVSELFGVSVSRVSHIQHKIERQGMGSRLRGLVDLYKV